MTISKNYGTAVLKTYCVVIACGLIALWSYGENLFPDPQIKLQISVVSDTGIPVDQVKMQIDKSRLNDRGNGLIHEIVNADFDHETSLPLELSDYNWSIKCHAKGYHPLDTPPIGISIYKIKEQLKFYNIELNEFKIPVAIVLRKVTGRLLPATTQTIVFDRKKQIGTKIDLNTFVKTKSPQNIFWELISPEDEGKEDEFSSREILPMIKTCVLRLSGQAVGGFLQVSNVTSLYDLKQAPEEGYRSQVEVIWDDTITPLFAFVKVGEQYGKISLERTRVTRSGIIEVSISCIWGDGLNDRNLNSDNKPEDLSLPQAIDLKNANIDGLSIH